MVDDVLDPLFGNDASEIADMAKDEQERLELEQQRLEEERRLAEENAERERLRSLQGMKRAGGGGGAGGGGSTLG